MVHIDPEDDMMAKPNSRLPDRDTLMRHLETCWGEPLPDECRLVLHYLDGHVEAELFLEQGASWDEEKIRHLRVKCAEVIAGDPYFHSIRLHSSHAP